MSARRSTNCTLWMSVWILLSLVFFNFPLRLIFRSKERKNFRWMKGTHLKANFRLWFEAPACGGGIGPSPANSVWYGMVWYLMRLCHERRGSRRLLSPLLRGSWPHSWTCCPLLAWPKPNKKDIYRREGKGRRCFLGDRIASIPCQASYFVPGWDEQADLHPILQIVLAKIRLFFKSS